jgi:23S rRNA (adenine2030-N6)-methyltransferase
MNYRHAFHAGNFADVVKHIVLARILVYLQEKPAPFRVIDTHAGAGLYDLTSDEAQRGGEWQHGIGRLLGVDLGEREAALLAPYLDVIRSFNPGDEVSRYPGSPVIARALLRPQDSLVACELEPAARKTLIRSLNKDPQARIVDIDGWVALTAYVPPKERRGLVLIDPPFEKPDEFDRFAEVFEAAFRKWSSGTFALWYPIKNARMAGRFAERIAQVVADVLTPTEGNPKAVRDKCLRITFDSGPSEATGLTAAGLLVVNPPWTLKAELEALAPRLGAILGQGGRGALRLDHPAP